MIGVEPSSIYVGRNTSDGTPTRLLPFKPSPDRTNNGCKLFKALNNTTLVAADQAGTPYQFSFIVSLFNSIGVVSLYNNTNANITFDVTLNLSGTVTFTVTDINGSTAITTTQALEVGWSYELTFQYTYNGEFIPITYFLRSVFMRIMINGRLANRTIDFDGSASIAPALAASTLTVTSSANTFVAAISQWWSAWWVSLGVVFAWQWWYKWWFAWWRSWWWKWWKWWLYVWWNCVLTGCAPTTNCGPNACHGAAPFDQLYRYDRRVGDIDFVLAGVGIRDVDTNVNFASLDIDTGPTATSIIKVYLYWNTIGSDINCPKTAIIDSIPVTGDIVGCTGNTCWAAFCVNNRKDSAPGQPNQNILNKVWFKDITSLGLVPIGASSHTISIPTVFPGVFLNKQGVHYPGCQGGQGIALLVIYGTPPKVVTRPLQRCCKPPNGPLVTERETREIIIWHGAKLLMCGDCSPPTVGGSPSYTIPWKTKYTWNPKLATAVGDPQADAPPANSLVFNSTVFLPQPKYFNPINGNLLQVKTEYPPAHSAKCNCGPSGQDNTITASTTSDCLNWFLFVWSGGLKCVTPVISASASFTSPPTMAMSLWNPNPPDCCPVRVPCCGQVCLPAKLNVVITSQTLPCTCFGNQSYVMNWDKTQQKYIFQHTTVCGCTLFGSLYCVGSQWTLYLALYSGETLCSYGTNANFPINCSPFGGLSSLSLINIDEGCSCSCLSGTLMVNISMG